MRPGRGLVVTGSILVVASVVGIMASVGMFFSSVVGGIGDAVGAPTFSVPVEDAPMELEQGTYVVFAVERSGAPAITASDVQVTGPSGALAVSPDAGQTLDNAQGSFASVASFTTPSAGSYRLTVEATSDTVVLVSKGIGGIFGEAGVSAAVGGASGIVFVFGLVLLVVGVVRRGRRGGPPAGGPGGGPAGPSAGGNPYAAPPGTGQPWGPQPQQPGYPPTAPGYPPPQPGQPQPPASGYPPQPGYPPPPAPGYPPPQ